MRTTEIDYWQTSSQINQRNAGKIIRIFIFSSIFAYIFIENSIYCKLNLKHATMLHIIVGKTASLHPDLEDQCFQSLASLIPRNGIGVTHILHDGDLNSCLLPTEIASNRLHILVPLVTIRRHFDFRLVGQNLPCLPFSALRVLGITIYENGTSEFSICTLKHTEDCKYRCECPRICSYMMVDIIRLTEASVNLRLCEVLFIM